MSLFFTENLRIGYDNTVVATVPDFAVEENDYLAIVGENGAGKSTLMKTLLNLTKPIGGQIVNEKGFRREEIGYLPQQTETQRDFPASVGEVVLSGCAAKAGWRPFYTKEERALAKENLRRMGVEDLFKRSYRDLSGGQRQRVLLSRALCATGRVLLLDEPVSGLDPKSTAEMYALVRGLNEEGVAIVMISHDVNAAVQFAKHILHLGQTSFFGTTEEYVNSPCGRGFLDRTVEGGGNDGRL